MTLPLVAERSKPTVRLHNITSVSVNLTPTCKYKDARGKTTLAKAYPHAFLYSDLYQKIMPML